MDSYKDKYLKYKNKYLILKNQIGGDEKIKKGFEQLIKMIKSAHSTTNANFIRDKFPQMFNILKMFTKKAINDWINDPNNMETKVKFIEVLNYRNYVPPNLEEVGLIIGYNGKNCTEQEFRLSKDPVKECSPFNYNQWKGECGVPSIEDAHKITQFLDLDHSNILISLLDTIKTHFEGHYDKITLGIHVGGASYCILNQLTKSHYNINIYFEPLMNTSIIHYSTDVQGVINNLICEIQAINLVDNTESITKSIGLKIGFPLHINDENDKKFINKIIEISKLIYVNFINAICLSTFQTFYILQKRTDRNNFSFISCPSQNTPEKVDSSEFDKIKEKYQRQSVLELESSIMEL